MITPERTKHEHWEVMNVANLWEKNTTKKVVLSQQKVQQKSVTCVQKGRYFLGKKCADFGGFGCLKSYFLAVKKKNPWGNLTAIFSSQRGLEYANFERKGGSLGELPEICLHIAKLIGS